MSTAARARILPAATRARHAAWASDGLVATVRVIADEVKRRGIDPAPLLRAHGLHEAPLWSPFSRGPRGAILCFIEDCLRETGDPSMHVTATAAAEIGAFHMADYLGLLAPTWGAGCRAIMERFHLVNAGCAFAIDDPGATGPSGDDNPAEISARFYPVYEPRCHPIEAECTFVAFEGRMRIATGGRYGLASVDFAHPENGSGERIAALVACSVRFGQGQNRITFERAGWNFQPSFFSAAGRAIVQAAVAPFAAAIRDDDLVHDVRDAVSDGVAHGVATLDAIARRLGMSQRSLQRRLAEKGTSFAKLVDQKRHEHALRRMAEPGARASEVGHALGFSEPSAFTRAFRRWTGMSPTEYAATCGRRAGGA